MDKLVGQLSEEEQDALLDKILMYLIGNEENTSHTDFLQRFVYYEPHEVEVYRKPFRGTFHQLVLWFRDNEEKPLSEFPPFIYFYEEYNKMLKLEHKRFREGLPPSSCLRTYCSLKDIEKDAFYLLKRIIAEVAYHSEESPQLNIEYKHYLGEVEPELKETFPKTLERLIELMEEDSWKEPNEVLLFEELQVKTKEVFEKELVKFPQLGLLPRAVVDHAYIGSESYEFSLKDQSSGTEVGFNFQKRQSPVLEVFRKGMEEAEEIPFTKQSLEALKNFFSMVDLEEVFGGLGEEV